jgi:hypothetical protein
MTPMMTMMTTRKMTRKIWMKVRAVLALTTTPKRP